MNKNEQLDKVIVSWQNPDEFLKYVWVEDAEHGGAMPFMRLPHLVDLWDTLLNNRLIILMKARQIAVSWTLAGYCCWKLVTKPMSRILVISVGEKEAKEFLAHVRFIYTNLLTGTDLPPMMEAMRLSPDSSEEVGILWDKDKDIRSHVIALPCTGTAGTSYTATDVICDEYDKWRTADKGLTIQEKSFSALKPPIDRTKGHFIVVSTTEILEPESFFKKLWRGARAKTNGFVARFYGVTNHPLYSEEWFESLCTEMSDQPWVRRQDYPRTEEEALEPPGEERIFTVEPAPSDVWVQEKPWIHVLHPFISGWKYVAGADVASGHGADYSVLTIIGKKGLDSKVVAVIHSKTLTTYEFAREIYQLCERYNFPLLAIERNAMGVAVVDALIEMKYPRLYYKDDNARKNGKPGVDTGQSARQQGVNPTGGNWIWKRAEAVNSGALKATFPPMVRELQDFFWIDGKAQARGNDDTVMALAITNSIQAKAPSGGIQMLKLNGKRRANTLVRT